MNQNRGFEHPERYLEILLEMKLEDMEIPDLESYRDHLTTLRKQFKEKKNNDYERKAAKLYANMGVKLKKKKALNQVASL